MTPDTLNYMVAGYVVILVGIVGYVASLVIRSVAVGKKIVTSRNEEKKNSV